MYIPAMNRMENQEEILAFMRGNNFATVVSVQGGIPVATHIPITITTQDDIMTLRAHFAKANPQWKALSEGETLIIFTGAHAYISPTHYDKVESVPTWNYMAVHAYGNAKLVQYGDNPQAMNTLLEELISTHEASYMAQWESLSDKYKDGMMNGVVGFEMVVTRLDAKAKLSQNKNAHEQERIIHTMLGHSDSDAVAIGEAMQKRLP
ncbi:MAG: FMN-binding negative transcriptional regulator [bacterium]|nr:FMN-binding negative transcriptional regulator [bacterium]